MSNTSPREQLGKRLRQYRTRSGLLGSAMAEELGTTQSRISRIETGKTRIDVEEVRKWLVRAFAPNPAPDDDMDEMVALAQATEVQFMAWREFRGPNSDARIQKRYNALEHQAKIIRVYQEALIPGLMQAAGYCTHLYRDILGTPEDEVPGAVAARLARQKLLYEPGRRLEVVVTEQVLQARSGGASVRFEQLRRIVDLAMLPTVDFRVIPMATDMAETYDVSFELMELEEPDGDSTVFLDLPHRSMSEDHPAAVEEYRQRFLTYQAAALDGKDATALVEQIARSLAQEMFTAQPHDRRTPGDTPPHARDEEG